MNISPLFKSSRTSVRRIATLRTQLVVLAISVSAALAPRALAAVDYEPYAVTTFAGIPGTTGFANGTGTVAPPPIHEPSAVALDSAGNRYLATLGGTIRKITPNGVMTTLAGLENH